MSSDNILKKLNGKKLIHKKEKDYLVDKVLIDKVWVNEVWLTRLWLTSSQVICSNKHSKRK